MEGFQSLNDGEIHLIGLVYITPIARALCQRFSTIFLAYKAGKDKLLCFRKFGFTALNFYFTAAVCLFSKWQRIGTNEASQLFWQS